MNGQLKQRIVGISVLAFLALIILPWLFGNNPPMLEQKKVQMINEEELPKVKVETPPKPMVVPEKMSPVQPVLPIAPPEETIEPPIMPSKKGSDFAPRVDELNASKITKIENSIVHTQTDDASESDEVVLKAPDFNKIKVSAKQSKKTVKTIDKTWTVQLGRFNNKSNVAKLVEQLKVKGYPVYVKAVKNADGTSSSRVFVGPSDRHESEQMVRKIEKLLNIHSVIVKYDT